MSDTELKHLATAVEALGDRIAADHPEVQRMSAEAMRDNQRRQIAMARKLRKGGE